MSIQILAPIFFRMMVLILLGLFLKRAGLINDELQRGFSRLLLSVIMPVNIANSALQVEQKPTGRLLGVTLLIIFAYYVIGILFGDLCARLLFRDEKQRKIFSICIIYANVGFIGIPMTSELFGYAGGSMYAVVHALAFNLMTCIHMTRAMSGTSAMDLKTLARTPINYGGLIALLAFLFPIRLPAFIMDTTASISAMTVPLSMLIIGAQMAGADLKGMIKSRLTVFICLFRLVVVPLIMLGVLRAIGADPVTRGALVLLSAMPVGSVDAIFAERYDCLPQETALAVVSSNIFMLVTIPAMMLLV